MVAVKVVAVKVVAAEVVAVKVVAVKVVTRIVAMIKMNLKRRAVPVTVIAAKAKPVKPAKPVKTRVAAAKVEGTVDHIIIIIERRAYA